jgi:hypothetical protein
VFGELIESLSYRLYLTAALNGSMFSPSGWRGGRQKGNRVLLEDVAVTARVDWQPSEAVVIGSGVQYAGVDQDQFAGVDAQSILLEGHAQYRSGGLHLRGLVAYTNLAGAAGLSLGAFPDDPAAPESRLIASEMYGGYFEVAYDIWDWLSGSDFSLRPFFRYEYLDSQASVPMLAGRSADKSQEQMIFDGGVQFYPHSQVVLKINYRDVSNEAGTENEDSLVFGAGFVY